MTLSFNNIKEDMQPNLEYLAIDADNGTVAGTGVDMLGYQGVVFFATAFQGEAATWSIKVQQDSASTYASAADLEGTSVSFVVGTDSDGFAFVEVQNPGDRYVRPVLTAPDVSTATTLACFSLRYGKDYRPETNTDGEFHYAPDEGTA